MIARIITRKRLVAYWYIYLLVLPSILIVSLFSYAPAISGIYHAFFRWNGDYINDFVGLANFAEAFQDPVLWGGFGLIGILVLFNIFKMIPSVLTAVVINRLKSEKAAYVYKVLFVVPMIIPGMVSLLIWKFFFDSNAGMLNLLLHKTGIMQLLCSVDSFFHWGIFVAGINPIWLGDTNLIIPSLIFWGFPWVGVVGVLIYLAGLQNIDKSIYEAADLDGISSFQKLLRIEFPLIMSQVRINLVMMIIGTLQDYALILVLFGKEAGPNGKAMVPGLYMFINAFVNQRAGYACAIGIIMFAFILILTEINNRLVTVDK